jgi:hypothetical protein
LDPAINRPSIQQAAYQLTDVARGALEERRRIATDSRFGGESNDDERTKGEHSDAERTSIHLMSPAGAF